MTLRPTAIGTVAMAAVAMIAMMSTTAWPQQKPPAPKIGTVGTWAGTVTQVGSPKGYALVLTIRETGGETDYPELKCGGKLTLVGASGGYTFFIEKITRGGLAQGGQCIDGSITIVATGNRLAWGWVGADQGKATVAFSTLSRK